MPDDEFSLLDREFYPPGRLSAAVREVDTQIEACRALLEASRMSASLLPEIERLKTEKRIAAASEGLSAYIEKSKGLVMLVFDAIH
jgi:hypothetical protein